MRQLSVITVLAAFLSACGAEPPEAPAPRATASTAPALGKADGSDQADRACSFVLRDVSRVFGGQGYVESCQGSSCNFVWRGNVDVAKDAFPQGATVGVLYHLVGDAGWWEVQATPTTGPRPGFSHYGFEISEHLFGAQASEDQLATLSIELVPFIQLGDGTRLFDHNRHSGDLENYVLRQSDGFAVGADASCPAVAGTIHFQSDWQETLIGSLHADGWLAVDYSLDRLPECRGTHNGHPAWDTLASVRFLPSGEVVTASVRELESVNGTPTNSAHEKPLEVKIPADATSVELWFHNYSGAGQSCDTWDSNFGSNYVFEILPAMTDPRCQNIETWSEHWGGVPTCVAYELSEQVDATHCELYVSGFGNGHEGHYGIPFDWLEAYVEVGPQDGQLLNVGMYTRYSEAADGMPHDRFSLGKLVSGSTYKTGFTYLSTGMQSLPSYSYVVEQVAFFVDVRRPAGNVVRLWQSHGGANYSWDDAFGAGTTTTYIPYGNVKYANDGATILENRTLCQ